MSNSIGRHPDAATILAYAAGTLPEPLSAVVAAHLAMCDACRDESEDMELLGSVLMLADCAERFPAVKAPPRPREGIASADQPNSRHSGDGRLPGPIAQAYGISFDTIPWRRVGLGVWHHRLPLSAGVTGDLRLLKIAPGCEMPDHGHGGMELTLVLDGAYADETGEYRRGDVQDVDEDVVHRPIADKTTGCICIIASERPARFKTVVGRILQPLTGM